MFHTATFDYKGERFGNRAVGIAEQPYLDPNSKSRTEELEALEAAAEAAAEAAKAGKA